MDKKIIEETTYHDGSKVIVINYTKDTGEWCGQLNCEDEEWD